jgi:predicted nuclease with TOPRIM domain
MDTNDIPTSALGLYQYIIATLASVITAMAGANVWQYRAADAVNKARLTERDELKAALSDVNTTLAAMSATSQRRNEVMDKLGDLISQVGVALKMLTDRLELQHEHSSKDLERAIEVTESLADAVRAVAGEVKQGFTEVKSKL